jgi:dTDP-4-amino-4,6-dideoxygalactose transaminase
MDNLRAAILRPQLRSLDRQCIAWNDRYAVVDDGLAGIAGLCRVERPAAERFVASSYQFLLLDWDTESITAMLSRCLMRGVELKWFGAADPVGFTSRYDSWTYALGEPMPKSDRILKGIIDMRLPLTFSLKDCALVARIISQEVVRGYNVDQVGGALAKK